MLLHWLGVRVSVTEEIEMNCWEHIEQCRAAFRAVEIKQIGTKMQSLCSEHHLVILILLKASATKRVGLVV